MTPGQNITRTMQRHILATLVQDPVIFGRVAPVLNPDYFTDEATSDIIAFMAAKWRTHHEVPSKAALLDAFTEESRKDVINRAFKANITDKGYTVQRIVDYAQDRAVRLAIMKAAEHLEAVDKGTPPLDKKGNPIDLDFVKLMRDAVAVGSSVKTNCVLFNDILDSVAADILNPERKEKFTTGSTHLDEAGLMLERGEIGCILGSAKTSKSFWLLHLAMANVAQGKNVIYYNVEIKENRLNQRIAKKIAGKKVDASVDPRAFVERMRERAPKWLVGKLFLQRYYAGVQTFDDVRAHLDQVRASGIKVDMIIVDYVGIMGSRSGGASQEERHRLTNLWVEFRSVCAEYDVAGWGAAQANREGARSDLKKATDISEAYGIISQIDAGFSVNMTEEERDAGIGRVYVMASRNSKEGAIINYTHDLGKSLIQTTGIAAPEKTKKKGSKPTTDEEREEAQHQKARLGRKKPAEKAESLEDRS